MKNTHSTKTAYLDCTAGISGDMTLGALIDAGVPVEVLNRAIGSLGLPNIKIEVNEITKCGIRAKKADVIIEPEHDDHHHHGEHHGKHQGEHHHHHHHRHLPEILQRINSAEHLTDNAKRIASSIFQRLGEAEAKVHGISIDKVHFHEVGAADSIADIVGAAVGFDHLGIDRVVASPVAVGSGTIKISHGIVPVPAPATAELLWGIPTAPSPAEAELTTPTGAAILAELASEFGPMPPMRIEQIGYGAGNRDFESHANIVRLTLGQAATNQMETGPSTVPQTDEYGTLEAVWMLETNLDDISGEAIGYCIERCWTSGALDVFTFPIQMKKSRPGVLLSVICHDSSLAALERILFEETTTLGVRRTRWTRRILDRRAVEVDTPFGKIQGKVATLPDGTERFTPEYDSCRQIAETTATPLQKIYTAACRAFEG